jgi:hypothetical protein
MGPGILGSNLKREMRITISFALSQKLARNSPINFLTLLNSTPPEKECPLLLEPPKKKCLLYVKELIML